MEQYDLLFRPNCHLQTYRPVQASRKSGKFHDLARIIFHMTLIPQNLLQSAFPCAVCFLDRTPCAALSDVLSGDNKLPRMYRSKIPYAYPHTL